jgi:hypothetical protein
MSEIGSPLDYLDSFWFEYSVATITDDGPDGVFTSGAFVRPSAVTCRWTNPALVGGNLGTVTAIEADFWFDDGFFGAEREDRSDDFSVEALSACPGAEEFWNQADHLSIFAPELFELTGAVETDAIDGFEVWELRIGSVSDDVMVDGGTVVVTTDGWPLRATVTGFAPGGGWYFFPDDTDPGESPDVAPFELSFALSDVNGSQLVVSPDGAIRVGPHAAPVPSVQMFTEPSEAVTAKMEAAEGTLCMQTRTGIDLLRGRDLRNLRLHTVSAVREPRPLFTTIEPGLAGSFGAIVEIDAAPLHSDVVGEVYFHHYAPVFALADWTTWMPSMSEDGEIAVSFAGYRWDGSELQPPDGSTFEYRYHWYLALPDEGLAVGSGRSDELRMLADEWIDAATDIASRLRRGDAQAAADLQGLVETIDDARALGCVALGTAWVEADAVLASGSWEFAPFANEVAAQNFLNSTEYVEILADFLDQPDVDWLLGDDIVLTVDAWPVDDDGATSSVGSVLVVMTDLLAESLELSNPQVFFFG